MLEFSALLHLTFHLVFIAEKKKRIEMKKTIATLNFTIAVKAQGYMLSTVRFRFLTRAR